MAEAIEVKMGMINVKMEQLESDIKEIKDSQEKMKEQLNEITNLLFRWKGIAVGIALSASTFGGIIGYLIGK